MAITEALEFLNTLVDDSDPDIELDQLQHLLQTSEAIRADGHEDWFVLAGFVHDLGKFFAFGVSLNGLWLGTRFPSGAHSAIALFTPNSSSRTRIPRTLI